MVLVIAKKTLGSSWSVPQILQHDSNPVKNDSPPIQASGSAPPSSDSGVERISPVVLFIIVMLAAIFFISGLLHLLMRYLFKKRASARGPGVRGQPPAADAGAADTLQRQLQQLFHLHDAGLDQVLIDALPVFLYREVVGGAKEPFDCAVCLCEFRDDDSLRLLPLCGHAFHIDCIDTWLLSNSTCPLCRGLLFVPGAITVDNPVFEFDYSATEQDNRLDLPGETATTEVKRVFPVRLGKFKSVGERNDSVGAVNAAELIARDHSGASRIQRREAEESSSSNMDARRCYSMGSYQYVLANADLRVALAGAIRRSPPDTGAAGARVNDEVVGGKVISCRSKADSFSTSKIWQWRGGGNNGDVKLPVLAMEGGWHRPRSSLCDT